MTSMVDNEIDEDATVGVAADLLGVTVRTLHHWDEIGLASPSRRTPGGYRLYTWDDLERLSRVVAYREGRSLPSAPRPAHRVNGRRSPRPCPFFSVTLPTR